MKKICICFLVIAMLLTGCSDTRDMEQKYEGKLLLRVGAALYAGEQTEEFEVPMGDSGNVAGHIESSVAEGEIPRKSKQSNFGGIGNSYTFDFGNGTIDVFIDDGWYMFEKVEDYWLP